MGWLTGIPLFAYMTICSSSYNFRVTVNMQWCGVALMYLSLDKASFLMSTVIFIELLCLIKLRFLYVLNENLIRYRHS